MANGKIEYSKPELLDIGGVGDITSGQSNCLDGSNFVHCRTGPSAEDRCTAGGAAVYGCGNGNGGYLPAPCTTGTNGSCSSGTWAFGY